jgi:hypothetical protein
MRAQDFEVNPGDITQDQFTARSAILKICIRLVAVPVSGTPFVPSYFFDLILTYIPAVARLPPQSLSYGD